MHETNFSLKISYSTHACLAQMVAGRLCFHSCISQSVHKGCPMWLVPVMSLVSHMWHGTLDMLKLVNRGPLFPMALALGIPYLLRDPRHIWPVYRNWFIALMFSCNNTNLSVVIVTMFHVDAQNSVHCKNSVFHNRHSNSPRIPGLWILLVSLRVKLNMSRITEAKKSITLWKYRRN